MQLEQMMMDFASALVWYHTHTYKHRDIYLYLFLYLFFYMKKKHIKIKKYRQTGNLFGENLQLKDVC